MIQTLIRLSVDKTWDGFAETGECTFNNLNVYKRQVILGPSPRDTYEREKLLPMEGMLECFVNSATGPFLSPPASVDPMSNATINKKWAWISALALVLGIAIALVFRQTDGPGATLGGPAKSSLPAVDSQTQKPLDPKDGVQLHQALDSLYNSIAQRPGVTRTGTVQKSLDEAIASGDLGKILRAFDSALYDYYSAKMNESAQAFEELLSHPDPKIRILAIKSLYTTGRTTGYNALREIIRSSNEVHSQFDKGDLRLQAIEIAGKFREQRAGDDIAFYLQQTGDGSAVYALCNLGDPKYFSSVTPYIGHFIEYKLVQSLGRMGSPQAVPVLKSAPVRQGDIKFAVNKAWTLHRLTKETTHLDSLRQFARQAYLPAQGAAPIEGLDRLEILRVAGSVRDSGIKQVLEEAIRVGDRETIAFAAVNLATHYESESSALDSFLIEELSGSSRKLDLRLLMQIASHSDSQNVRDAGVAYDLRATEKYWNYWAVERRDWPEYLWADDFTILEPTVE